MNTILIIGGSGGIGASFAHRFHSMGKTVIVTGRNTTKLNELSSTLPGLKTYTMDMTDIASLPSHVSQLTKTYPNIDTIWINGGIQQTFQFSDTSTSSDSRIRNEIDTNVTAPMIIARHAIPFLLERSKTSKTPTNFLITSSGLAFVPLGTYPVYCPTKAFIHHFLVGLRQQMNQLSGSNINIIEIVPPRVETDLDAAHKESTSMPAMPLEDFTSQMFEILDGAADDGRGLKEVGVGFAEKGIKAWRGEGSIGGILEGMGLGG